MEIPGARILPEILRIPCRMLRSNLNICVLCVTSVHVTDNFWAIRVVAPKVACPSRINGEITEIANIHIWASGIGPNEKIGNLNDSSGNQPAAQDSAQSSNRRRKPKSRPPTIISWFTCEIGDSQNLNPGQERKRSPSPHPILSERKN